MSIDNSSLSNIDANTVVHPYTDLSSHQKNGPKIITSGKGIYVYDDAGKEYIEGLSGLWCTTLGFQNQRIVNAATRAMEQLPFYHCFGGKSHPNAIKLAENLIDLAPDQVLAYTIKPIIWGGIAARLIGFTGFNAMITGLGYAFEKGSLMRNSVNYLVKHLYKFSLKKARKVIFQNQENRQLFVDLGLVQAEKCYRVFGSGVDIDAYQQQPLPQGDVTFLLIARLLGDKGIREYAQAAKIVKQRYPSSIFQLLGPYDSSPDQISADEIAQWQLDGQIEYLGATDNVIPFIQACHIYTLPSYHEGLPRTVLEAMSIGRPILTTDAVGCRDTVANGDNGWLVPVRDTEQLASRMIWFIENPTAWHGMANNSRAMVEDKFNVKQVNQAIRDIMGL